MTYRGDRRRDNNRNDFRFLRTAPRLDDHPEIERPDPTESLWVWTCAGYSFVLTARLFGGYNVTCDTLGIEGYLPAGTLPAQVVEALASTLIDSQADDGPDFCPEAYGVTR